MDNEQLPSGWYWRWRDEGRYGELMSAEKHVIAYIARVAPQGWGWAVAQRPEEGSAESRDAARIAAETAVMGQQFPYPP